MAYFKIGQNDYSMYVNALKVTTKNVYTSKTSAAGNTVVDIINTKHTVDVGIIPLNDTVMAQLQADIAQFNTTISYRDPETNLTKLIQCIIPSSSVEYYTIQVEKVMYKGLKLTFTEL